jgi:carbonic anhydrase
MPNGINKLIAGYQQFRRKYFSEKNTLFQDLVKEGQKPEIMVLACSDSRVDPSIILNCQPGDLFVVRNVANLIPPYENDSSYHGTSAALEFAVCNLQVSHVVILGHSQCGGMQALLSDNDITEKGGFIARWITLAKPARDHILHDHPHASFDKKVELCTKQALLNSLENLSTFPWIKQKVAEGSLQLHAWFFDLSTGIIFAYDKDQHQFVEW